MVNVIIIPILPEKRLMTREVLQILWLSTFKSIILSSNKIYIEFNEENRSNGDALEERL